MWRNLESLAEEESAMLCGFVLRTLLVVRYVQPRCIAKQHRVRFIAKFSTRPGAIQIQ